MARKSNTEQSSSSSKKRAAASGTKQIIYSLDAGTPIFVTAADICTAFGKTKSRISQLTGDGIIHKTTTNYGSLYNLFETVKAYCAYIKDSVNKVDENTAALELRRKKAEAKLKESKATVAELEAAEFQGKMHRSEDVQAMTADLLYYVRGSLLALAGRCATDCAASDDPAEIQKIIEREVFAILHDLSEYKYDSKRYDELVRQRMKREVDTDVSDGDEDNE